MSAVDISICHVCGAPMSCSVAARSYCSQCAEELLAPIRSRAMVDESGVGRALPDRQRLDHGHGFYDVMCSTCSATWVDRPMVACPWCEQRVATLLDAEHDSLLRPDLPERGDPRREHALEVWARRLAHAVKAGYVTEGEARIVLGREEVVRHVA